MLTMLMMPVMPAAGRVPYRSRTETHVRAMHLSHSTMKGVRLLSRPRKAKAAPQTSNRPVMFQPHLEPSPLAAQAESIGVELVPLHRNLGVQVNSTCLEGLYANMY